MNNIQVSENFRLSEFQCKCGCETVKLDSELLRRLQAIRTQIGRPMIINSGYRCQGHNRSVGSTDTSQHRTGRAADIVVRGMSVQQLYNICDQRFQDGGVGRYSGHVHVDTRGSRARWAR